MILKYLTIYFLCMFKIIFGPTMGYTAGLHPLISVALTVAGMMTTVIIFSYLGQRIRESWIVGYFKPKKLFSKKTRRFVRIWRKYGELGISFLTPILLSPPGGTLLVMAFGGSRRKTIVYMFVWSVFWSFVLTYSFYYSGNAVREFLGYVPKP